MDVVFKGQQNVKIEAFYGPSRTDDKYKYLEDDAKAINQVNTDNKGNISIAGDYNFPYIDLSDLKTLPGNTNTKTPNILINSANDHSLTQAIDHPRRKDNIPALH